MGKCINENREQKQTFIEPKEENISSGLIFKKPNLYQTVNTLARKNLRSCYICTN
jgi:hypothetical protein